MKKIFWITLSIAVAAILLILSLPKIASTSLGKKIIESVVTQRLGGELDIGSWDLSWFGPQTIRNTQFKGSHLEFSFTELQAELSFWSFFSFLQFDKKVLRNLDGSAFLQNAQVLLYEESEPTVYVQNINVKMHGNEGENIYFELTGTTQVEQISGHIEIEASIASLDDFFKEEFPTFLKINLNNFPSRGIDRWISSLKIRSKNALIQALQKDPDFFMQIIGPKINFDFTFQSNEQDNSLMAMLSASYASASIDANIEGGNLYLKKDFQATFQMGETLAKYLLKDVNPLFVTSIRSINPITLNIEAKGFQFPINFRLPEMFVANATLNVGKLFCENGKTLSLIIALLKLQSLEKTKEMMLWFTPLNFQIRNGIVVSERMDVLVTDNIHVCTWGDIRLDNNNMDMILGIPADTLQQVFKVKGLPSDYVMQIPLKGTTDFPKINMKKVSAKIGALIAAQLTEKKVPAISELLKILDKRDKEKAPPPKKPFPWENP